MARDVPFRKLLVANRGEVAVRVMRACAELGIGCVGVYTEPDRHGLHVKRADEAHSLGPDPLGGYLNAERLVDLAMSAGCEAIHPGYGFLSEHPALAEVCFTRGLRFVGPSAEVMRRMGDKTRARQAMIQAGVPVIPGSPGNLGSVAEAARVAEEIGYPVMLKATSGGGGRGIRRCNSESELRTQYSRVVSEATKAFGCAELFVEKCVVAPRHIEVQVLADGLGNVVHLFERDCSVQRRHQKLVEIAPSPQLSSAQRERVCELAVRAARAVGYRSAGTVEFLMDRSGDFYFIEMNPRLQVEHTVTEQITGVDIVQMQIRIAAGEPLPFEQQDIQRRGYAIQFRINAEDPKNDFLPSFGRITRYYEPGGPGVRTDSAIYTGYDMPPHFDSLCVKLTVWAGSWPEVLARGRRALSELGLYGVRNTRAFHLRVLETPDFDRGCLDTRFVEGNPGLTDYPEERPPAHLAAAMGAALAVQAGL